MQIAMMQKRYLLTLIHMLAELTTVMTWIAVKLTQDAQEMLLPKQSQKLHIVIKLSGVL